MNKQDHVIIALSNVKQELASIESIDYAREIRSRAEAVRTYAKQAGLSRDIINQVVEIRLRAERRAGELLTQSRRQRPGEYQRSRAGTVAPSLSELGISKSQSSHWQRLAHVPDPAFEEFLQEAKSSGAELTGSAAQQMARRFEGTVETAATITRDGEGSLTCLSDLINAGERFSCIYADPPWPYSNQGTRGATGRHYPTMDLGEIEALPVSQLAADSCHLHLWTTNGFLFESKRVMEAWGFEFKSAIVWVKPQLGLGNFYRLAHEYLLLGVRGRPTFRDKAVRSWLEVKRGRHSAKPAEFRQIVERVSPGPYLELFAREAAKGWTSWGNEVLGEPVGGDGYDNK